MTTEENPKLPPTSRANKGPDLSKSLQLPDEFNQAIIGICERFGERPFLVYDQSKVFEVLMSCEDPMSRDEALDWFYYNILGTGLEGVPGFVDTEWSLEDLDDDG